MLGELYKTRSHIDDEIRKINSYAVRSSVTPIVSVRIINEHNDWCDAMVLFYNEERHRVNNQIKKLEVQLLLFDTDVKNAGKSE